MAESTKHVFLRASANRFSIELMLVGGVAIAIVMLFVTLRATPISVIEIIFVATAIMAVILGFLKSREPFYSFQLDHRKICYYHKVGEWSIDISNISSVGVPIASDGFDQAELNAVGIKLKDEIRFLNDLHPRLACKLLIEQRHIFLQAVKMHCKCGSCPSKWLVEPSEFHAGSGQIYTGLIAMFANRMQHLYTLTGYHLLLPANVLDRDIWDFSNLLNHWKINPEVVVQELLKKQATVARSNRNDS